MLVGRKIAMLLQRQVGRQRYTTQYYNARTKVLPILNSFAVKKTQNLLFKNSIKDAWDFLFLIEGMNKGKVDS